MLTALLFTLPFQALEITIDATSQRAISPYIYGVNHPDWEKMGSEFTLARQGGNRMTAYNWETNASNAGADWHHQNDGYLGESNEPGWTVKSFVEAAQKHGAAALVTIPTAGYVAADKDADGDVNKTPDYLNKRFHKSLAKKRGAHTYPPDTTDRVVYQDEFVAWLNKVKSPKTPLWFSLDNEPDLWGHTHQRIWPKNPTYAQIIANNIEFAAGIKAVAPDSLVFGPANYGWMGFRTFQNAPDADGRDFLDVYLAAMKAAAKQSGRRLVDVLDIHWYPEAQGGGVRICLGDGTKDTPETHAARIQAPRSLWDPTYVEESWITRDYLKGKPIVLLPSVFDQIAKSYPGTKLAITEYNYGGPNHISGAIAQADVLGIFGRYGVFAATNWGLQANNKAEMAGFRAFTNYDRKGSRFGDLGLKATGGTPPSNSVYAALDSRDRNRLTVVLINKTKARQNYVLRAKGFAAKSGRVYVVSSDSIDQPRSTVAAVQAGKVNLTLPGESVATLELRSGG